MEKKIMSIKPAAILLIVGGFLGLALSAYEVVAFGGFGNRAIMFGEAFLSEVLIIASGFALLKYQKNDNKKTLLSSVVLMILSTVFSCIIWYEGLYVICSPFLATTLIILSAFYYNNGNSKNGKNLTRIVVILLILGLVLPILSIITNAFGVRFGFFNSETLQKLSLPANSLLGLIIQFAINAIPVALIITGVLKQSKLLNIGYWLILAILCIGQLIVSISALIEYGNLYHFYTQGNLDQLISGVSTICISIGISIFAMKSFEGIKDTKLVNSASVSTESTNTPTSSTNASFVANEISQYKELLELGIITEEEFEQKKKTLIEKI